MQKISFDLNKFLQDQKEIPEETYTIRPDTEDPLRIGLTQRAVVACSRHLSGEYEEILTFIREIISNKEFTKSEIIGKIREILGEKNA